MKFQFIDNDSTQKPGARKAIRSHVMKGKNLGRTIQGRGKRHAASQVNNLHKSPDLSRSNVSVEERRKSLDDAVNNVGNDLLFPEILDTDTDTTYSINNPYSGKEYTYFSFPVQFTPSMRYYVYEFHTAICNIIYPFAFCRPTDEIGSPWFRYMVADQACNSLVFPFASLPLTGAAGLHCLLAMAATYLNILRNIPTPSVESIEATRHFSQALHLMNPRLSQPSAAQQDSNIAIIISLAIHSNITQNLTASAMHLQGLDSILAFRPGGISDIRECNRALLHKICRTDIELAVAQGTRTRFGNAGLTAEAAGPMSARNLAYPLNQMSELLRQVTRELLALCRRPGKAKMSGLQYQDVLISMWQRLVDFAPLSGTRPQDLMDDVWQLALLAFLVTVTWSASHLKSVHCKLLHKLLKEHIESRVLLEKGEEYRPLWFWVVLVYGLSLTNGNCDTLVLDELREASELLGITKWEVSRAKVKSFPWIGIVHDVPGRALWEVAVISVPPQSFTLIPSKDETWGKSDINGSNFKVSIH
ncbi:Argininosuccinate synthase [Fusarium circinatum]|uniref:Argininosuccinate synthase n=1 Tax=Fusarium circinatum TaxID=48490 RepID=A0A8H5U391_FUSCI|nr:Argininosuccinate synthase [Fusarium circinatum]